MAMFQQIDWASLQHPQLFINGDCMEYLKSMPDNYAKQGDKILDTHVGSASSLIACHNLGFQYVGFEIDKDYYDQSLERLNRYKSQISLMDIVPKEDNKQIGMEV